MCNSINKHLSTVSTSGGYNTESSAANLKHWQIIGFLTLDYLVVLSLKPVEALGSGETALPLISFLEDF